MSQEFEVRTRLRRIGSFDELVEEWTAAIGRPVVLERNDDYAWVFAPGASIRGCSATNERRLLGSMLRLRLSVAASQADWEIAYALVRVAARRGGKATVWTDSVQEAAAFAFRADMNVLQRMIYEHDQDPLTLPNIRFSLTLTRDDLPRGDLSDVQLRELESMLASRTARYRDARIAPTITLRSGRTAALWSGEALIADSVDFLIFRPDPGIRDVDDYVYQPWDTALEKLGTAVEPVAGQVPSHFFRALDFAAPADRELWESLLTGARGWDELAGM